MLKAYDDLTPRGQARRLRGVAQAALEEFGFAHYRLQLIKHLINTTFRLDCNAGRFVVRVHRSKDRTLPEIESEVAWLEAIARDTDICVQTPRRTLDGRLVTVVNITGAPQCPVTVLSWLKGRVLSSDVRDARHYTLLGRLTAQLHAHSQVWRPPGHFDRPRWDAEGIMGSRAPYSLVELAPRLPAGVRRDLEEVYARLVEVEAALAPHADLHGLIHRDLTFSNVLFSAHEACPIDFDEGGFALYLHDFGSSLNGARWNDHYREHSAAYFAAYCSLRPLDEELLAHMPLMLAVRTATMILWAAAQSPSHSWVRGMGQWVRELLRDMRINQKQNAPR